MRIPARRKAGGDSGAALRIAGAFRRDESGASAVEMALLAPAFILLLLGIIQAGLLVYTKASLHYAVQKRVRCLAIAREVDCPAAATHYFAPGPAPTFTKSTPAGAQKCLALTGRVTYSFNLGLMQQNVLLSSTACFPDIYLTPAS